MAHQQSPALTSSATPPVAPAPDVPTSAPSQSSEDWSEERILESLHRLDDLHNRLISLRTVIPKILAPLTTDYATPVDMFQDFSSRAVSCSEEIASFNTLYMKSQPIFEHAAASRAQNPTGIRRLGVGEMFLPEEPESGQGTKTEDVEMKDAEEEKEEEKEVVVENTKDEEIDDVVEEFSGRLMHRDVEVEELPGGTPAKRHIKVVLPPPSSLLFTIEITPSDDNSRAFVVTSVKNARHPDSPVHNIHTGILRAVAARQWPGNLEMLLEMLGSYKNIYSAKCDKCKRLTAGGKGELPVVRKLLRDGKDKRWVAYHEWCV
ncbi:hypothetical protein FN846DRAFT_423032 [Sphaerosporella brunnea]|uniref:Mediator complex subunit 27-domain-containing protein n=1 Tax=Sphaerosporella brunnea TaxID=1250544 RepID=A0A5J5EGB2_9PEZI|nr:hypothetical protein FN846DRAFT_423032 [Sphaerosporella brunnea]